MNASCYAVDMVKETKVDEGTVATSVRLPADIRERLVAIATAERRTLGNVIRIALEDWLISRGKK
jgi:predicted transcriptional regulator